MMREYENMGRPIEINCTPEITDRICQFISEGGNLDNLPKEDGLPGKTLIYKWLRHNDQFESDYARARAIRAHSRSDKIDEYKRAMIAGTMSSDVCRVAMDAEKWQAGKENAKRYGDRQILQGDKDADAIKQEQIITVTLKMGDHGDRIK